MFRSRRPSSAPNSYQTVLKVQLPTIVIHRKHNIKGWLKALPILLWQIQLNFTWNHNKLFPTPSQE